MYNNDILWQGTVTQIIAQKINPEKFKNCALFIYPRNEYVVLALPKIN